ncbi:Uncharacterised protein [Mycobacteroides abscessus subsp. abscessus]|nr:Uncharacterised protein [Mycobacteroides abscessus subsp. abscessus]
MKTNTKPSSRWAATAATLALICVSGCTHTTPAPVSPSLDQVPANIHFSEHWTPTGAVDLMSPDGTFIRAFFEARSVQDYDRYGEAIYYPGHRQADRTGLAHIGADKPAYGYTTRWVLSLEERPDNTVTAFVCSDILIRATNEEVLTKPSEIYGEPFIYHRTGIPPLANQKGPARAPAVPVFGDWYATNYGNTSKSLKASNERCAKDPGRPALDKSPVSTPGWPVLGV